MTEIHERIQAARKLAGYETPTEAARAMGWNVSTYHSHENSSRGVPRKKVIMYSAAFKVNERWLLTGKGAPRGKNDRVPLIGKIGAGGTIIYSDDYPIGGAAEYVSAPSEAADDTVALEIEGDSMFPYYRDGWLVFYSVQVRPDSPECLGDDCVVRLVDGRTLLKTVMRGSVPGRFTLGSHNAPAIENAEVEWAAPVEFVDRRRRSRRVKNGSG